MAEPGLVAGPALHFAFGSSEGDVRVEEGVGESKGAYDKVVAGVDEQRDC